MTSSQALARAGLIVSGAFLVSRVLGWIRVFIIGNTFPAGPELDAFLAAFRLPDLMFQLVAAGALSSAVIPVVSALLATDETARAWRVVSTIANMMLLGLLILGVVVFVAAPLIVPTIIAPGWDDARWARTPWERPRLLPTQKPKRKQTKPAKIPTGRIIKIGSGNISNPSVQRNAQR
jgi:putative peptidoglycan lipid II flippase